MSRPNIVYFVVHDLGRHAGCYGIPIETPNIDRFAAESLQFNQAFCTSPACSPSRNCVMTGLYPQQSGGIGLAHMGWPLPAEIRTIVDDLNDAGYETIHAVMQHERQPRTNRYQVDLDYSYDNYNTEQAVDSALEHLRSHDKSRPFYLNLGSQQPHPSTWEKADQLYGGPVPESEVFVPHQPRPIPYESPRWTWESS